MDVWVRRQRWFSGGPGAAAQARHEVHGLAGDALLIGHAVSQRSEGDAALVASELVSHAGGACVLELVLTSGGFDILVSGLPSSVPALTGTGRCVFWWELVTRLARELTVSSTSPLGVTVRVRIDTR
ncbi:hypothetical protein ACFVU3_13495 [Streptomyces sp. NPDC058052]|uniref:hypothetical protein n=1 Tax=Streptomyces sp. NPDC058052 TaxID=3346316 RepID=UPI0036EE44F2